MKEPALVFQMHYLPGTEGADKISIDYKSIGDHKQHIYFKCPVDWVTDLRPQASQPNFIEAERSKLVRVGGNPYQDISHKYTSSCEGESETKRKESIDYHVSARKSDSTSTELLIGNSVIKPNVVEQCDCGVCEPRSNLFHEDATLEGSENSVDSNIDNKDVYSKATSVHSLNFPRNYTCKIKLGSHQVNLTDECSIKQRKQIIPHESFHKVSSSICNKLPPAMFESGCKIPSPMKHGSVNASLQNGVVCTIKAPYYPHISPNNKLTSSRHPGNIHLRDRQLGRCLCKEHFSFATEQDLHNKTGLQDKCKSSGIVSKMKVSSLREPFLTKYLSCRWKLAYMCFLARFIQTALRQCMGIAIIGMTMKTSNSSGNITNATGNSSQSQVPHMVSTFFFLIFKIIFRKI